MTKADAFLRAWKSAQKGNFSLFDEIVHTDYESENQGVLVNKETSKAVISGIGDLIIIGPHRTIYEDNNFLCFARYSKVREGEIFSDLISAVYYKDGKIIKNDTIREEIASDLSEGQDWNWEGLRVIKLGGPQHPFLEC